MPKVETALPLGTKPPMKRIQTKNQDSIAVGTSMDPHTQTQDQDIGFEEEGMEDEEGEYGEEYEEEGEYYGEDYEDEQYGDEEDVLENVDNSLAPKSYEDR